MARVLFTGTGRCGTTWVQAVLRVCGVNASHQTVFTFVDTMHTRQWDWRGFEVEASFMAVPVLPDIREREPDTKIVLLHRKPADVVRSWIKRGAFGDDMADEYPDWVEAINSIDPTVLAGSNPIERGHRYVDAWNAWAGRYAHHSIRVEETEPVELFEICGRMDAYDGVLANAISRTINT